MKHDLGKIILRNFIGVLLSLTVGAIAFYLTGILFGFVLSFGWISTLLSWPSTPLLYAITGMGGISVLCAFYLCDKICLPNSKGVKVGSLIVGIAIILFFSVYAIGSFISYGLSDYTWGYGVCAIMGAIAISSEIPNAHPKKNTAGTSKQERPEDKVCVMYEPEQQKPVNKLFCKNCGTECGPNDTKCPNCGKRVRYIPAKINYKILCIAFLLLSVGLCIALIVQSQQHNAEILDLKTEMKNIVYEPIPANDRSATPTLYAKWHVACITETGDRYHEPGCGSLSRSNAIYIVSVSGAERLGYTPCSQCHEPSAIRYIEENQKNATKSNPIIAGGVIYDGVSPYGSVFVVPESICYHQYSCVTIQNDIDEVYYFEDENSAITAGYRACPQCIK